MRNFLSLLVFWLFGLMPGIQARAQAALPTGNESFVAVALHDVFDRPQDLDADGVTTDQLVNFFDWLSGNGWTPISLDDVERAWRGIRPLPAQAILITVDDGYKSLYTRIYPLALAYRVPIVAALVGSWMDAPMGASVPYGEATVPRSHFISWDEAREMQASGWVEFATHSHALHTTVQANPQGNRLPAAITRQYLAGQSHESEAALRARLHGDLQRARTSMARELGRPPRALVWPFGAYSAIGVEVAQELGFEFALTLDQRPANTAEPMALPRYFPAGDPSLGDWATDLSFTNAWPRARRIVCVNPAVFASDDPQQTNARLGQAIERLRALGASHVRIDAVALADDGRIEASWFPNSQLPMRADLLSRLAVQMRDRAGVSITVRLPHKAALATLGDAQRVGRLFDDLGASAPIAALWVEDAPSFGETATPEADKVQQPWDVRRVRRAQSSGSWPAADALALRAFRAVERHRPGVELYWLAARGARVRHLSALADVTWVPAALEEAPQVAARMEDIARFRPPVSRRAGIWWDGQAPPEAQALVTASQLLQQRGATSFGWCPDDPLADAPAAARVAPALSAADFPRRGAQR